METSQHFGFSILSQELFGTFFSLDALLTGRIINTILDTDFVIEGVEEIGLGEESLSFYHPFVLADARTSYGRSVIALTFIDEDTRDATEEILNRILYRAMLMRRNIFPVILVFDTTFSFSPSDLPVTLRVNENRPFTFALAVAWVRNTGGKRFDCIFSDLLKEVPDEIEDDGIRRIYLEAYRRSGLEEKEMISYVMWLESIERDIRALGDIPGL